MITLFTLKIIAIVTMFLDHYYRIIGGPEWLSMLGRLAFPIFAFSISEGYSHTKNVNKCFLLKNIETYLQYYKTLFLHCDYIFKKGNCQVKLTVT